jgi:hypothetical protein
MQRPASETEPLLHLIEMGTFRNAPTLEKTF